MNTLQIEKFIQDIRRKDQPVQICFKVRSPVTGLFIISRDYQELKKKNFWRIVPESRTEEWARHKDLSCSRIFCGDEFTRLVDL